MGSGRLFNKRRKKAFFALLDKTRSRPHFIGAIPEFFLTENRCVHLPSFIPEGFPVFPGQKVMVYPTAFA